MKFVTLALAGLVLGASPALAQYGPYGPIMRPAMPIAGMPGDGVVRIVRDMGLDPVGAPTRSGNFYIQNAADYYGRPMRIVVDARRAQVVSVEALGSPGSIHGGPYAAANARYAPGPYGAGPYAPGPYGRGPYGPPDDDAYDGPLPPPSMRPTPHADLNSPLPPVSNSHAAVQPQSHLNVAPQSPAHAAAPKPATKSAAITPAKPPVPRKRPATAPQETAGTVEPLAPAKPAEAAPVPSAPPPVIEAKPSQPATPAATPAAPATLAMPPVAPLE